MATQIVADLAAKLGLKPAKAEWAAGDRLISGVKKGIAAIAAWKGASWLKDLVTSTANAADRFAKLAQSTGVGIEAVQELAHAADLSGVGLDALASSMGILNRNLDAASRGGKAQARAFRALGVAVKDAQGKLRPADAVLGDVADRFATMEDGPKKSALAMKVFGKSGAALIPMLNGGRKGLDEMRAEARRLGIVIDGETAAAFEQFNDDQTRLQAQMRGLKFQLVSALLPGLQRVMTAVLEWVAANRDLLRQRLEQTIRTAASAVTTMYRAVAPVAAAFYDTAKSAVTLLDDLGLLAPAAAAAGIALVAMTLPLAKLWLIAAAIGALTLAARELEKLWHGEDNWFSRTWEKAKKLVPQLARVEDMMVRLGMVEGQRLVGGESAGDVEVQSLANQVKRGRAIPVPRQTSGVVSGKIAELRGEDFDIGQQLRTQAQINDLRARGGSRPGASLDRRARLEWQKAMLAETGLGDTLAPFLGQGNRFQSMANLAQPSRELVANTIRVGDVYIDAKNADPAEVAKVFQAKLEQLTRDALDAAGVGAKP